jgi:Fe-S cluster assembly protein SufD
MDVAEVRELIKDPNAAELELIARFAEVSDDATRERAFRAFAATGLPHRRMEGWKWSDFRAALSQIDPVEARPAVSPFAPIDGPVITLRPGREPVLPEFPEGLRAFMKPGGQAFGGAEDMPMGALTAALADNPGALMIEVNAEIRQPLQLVFEGAGDAHFARIVIVVRPGASITVLESHQGGAGLSAALMEFGLQDGASLERVLIQSGSGEGVQSINAVAHLDEGSRFRQTALATGDRLARMETRLTHRGVNCQAVLNAAYLVGAGRHADFTSHVRHGAEDCVTRQLTKGAARKGGKGVFQGKFHVARIAQRTDADMQHNALLLEDGAEVDAKPELEIYADDVACAHGNTCGAIDPAQLFYLRQRGIPERAAKALLTEAHVAEAFDGVGDERIGDILRESARTWLQDHV